MNRKPSRGLAVYIAVLAVLMVTIYFAVSMMSETQTLKYYEVIDYFENGQVREFTMDIASGEMTLKIENDGGKFAFINYRCASPNMFYEDTKPLIAAYDLEHPDAPMKVDFIRPKDAPWWVSMIPYVVLFGVMAL
ncbi:MAG: hypothetical protein IKK98_01190, partial [Oscillospiraceae bacterium]|nr:hypothetical protein [Oscillospiraceae bacterium]